MTAPSEKLPVSEGLAVALERVLDAPVEITGLQQVTGGASRETWAFTANGEGLILRRDPPGRPGTPGAMRLEADAMRECTRAGLRVPEVLFDDDGTLFGTAGLVMRRVPGETIARRILRGDQFAEARSVLVRDLGQFLAGLHAIDPAAVPGLKEIDSAGAWDRYCGLNDRRPTFEKSYGWLEAHRLSPSPSVIVHGDFRLGNVIVDSRGLAAVIDWETVHLGDPHQDLAWLCIKAWRFGEPLEVAGLGTIDELVDAYESAGGRRIDRVRLHWWLVAETLKWGVGCMIQAEAHLSGRVRSVDLAAVGRRATEQEWDLIELIAPDAAGRALAAPEPAKMADDWAPYGRPTPRELLVAVRELLVEKVVPIKDRSLSYEARVAVNLLATVERQLAYPLPSREGDDWATLALVVRDKLLVDSPKHLGRARSLVAWRGSSRKEP